MLTFSSSPDLGDLPVSVTQDKLAKLVAAFGRVLQIRVQVRRCSRSNGVTRKDEG